jgi:hypothetical protein
MPVCCHWKLLESAQHKQPGRQAGGGRRIAPIKPSSAAPPPGVVAPNAAAAPLPSPAVSRSWGSPQRRGLSRAALAWATTTAEACGRESGRSGVQRRRPVSGSSGGGKGLVAQRCRAGPSSNPLHHSSAAMAPSPSPTPHLRRPRGGQHDAHGRRLWRSIRLEEHLQLALVALLQELQWWGWQAGRQRWAGREAVGGGRPAAPTAIPPAVPPALSFFHTPRLPTCASTSTGRIFSISSTPAVVTITNRGAAARFCVVSSSLTAVSRPPSRSGAARATLLQGVGRGQGQGGARKLVTARPCLATPLALSWCIHCQPKTGQAGTAFLPSTQTSAHLMAQASPGVCTSSWLTASRSPATATWVPVAVPTGGMVTSLQQARCVRVRERGGGGRKGQGWVGSCSTVAAIGCQDSSAPRTRTQLLTC